MAENSIKKVKLKTCACRNTSEHFLFNGNTCSRCRADIVALKRDYGYTLEEAKEKVSYGRTKEGKVLYWTMRLDQEWEFIL